MSYTPNRKRYIGSAFPIEGKIVLVTGCILWFSFDEYCWSYQFHVCSPGTCKKKKRTLHTVFRHSYTASKSFNFGWLTTSISSREDTWNNSYESGIVTTTAETEMTLPSVWYKFLPPITSSLFTLSFLLPNLKCCIGWKTFFFYFVFCSLYPGSLKKSLLFHTYVRNIQ